MDDSSDPSDAGRYNVNCLTIEKKMSQWKSVRIIITKTSRSVKATCENVSLSLLVFFPSVGNNKKFFSFLIFRLRRID